MCVHHNAALGDCGVFVQRLNFDRSCWQITSSAQRALPACSHWPLGRCSNRSPFCWNCQTVSPRLVSNFMQSVSFEWSEHCKSVNTVNNFLFKKTNSQRLYMTIHWYNNTVFITSFYIFNLHELFCSVMYIWINTNGQQINLWISILILNLA